MRGISVFWVAARTRLTPQRVEAIESGRDALRRDGQGRALARQLADAIGADPEAGAALLMGGDPARVWREERPPLPWLAWGARLGLALAAGVAAWLLATWLVSAPPDPGTRLVYRSDYVDRLLGDEGR